MATKTCTVDHVDYHRWYIRNRDSLAPDKTELVKIQVISGTNLPVALENKLTIVEERFVCAMIRQDRSGVSYCWYMLQLHKTSVIQLSQGEIVCKLTLSPINNL